MAGASREEIFDISAEKYFQALVNYEHYTKLISEVDEVKVLERSTNAAKIQYTINIVKSFSYILKLTEKRPERLEWQLDSGSLFKKNSGSWDLTPLGPDRCKVVYTVDVDLKVFAPSAITNRLVAVNLPKMMQAFYQYAQTL